MNDKERNLNSLMDSQNSLTNDDNVFNLPQSDFNLSLRIKSFHSTKDFELFVKNVEKLVRISNEYKLWTQYVTEHLKQFQCALTKESINECPVDIHHHPVTLYTIVKAVITKFLSEEREFSTFDIATKVIELHFQNKVGYIVLLSSLHSKYHEGFLNLPIELINGDYKYILQNYTIEENEYDRICSMCNVHIEDLKQSWHRDDYPGINEYKPKEISVSLEEKRLTA